ncbi:MAG: sigma-70 family RNA polymerase sigma factor [Planctomycetota bacterium]|nr:MAG: sigma-70 family RNA polymerase sigma factor [Planctomycetota bacterium]
MSMDASVRERFEAIAMPHLDVVYRVARMLADSEADAEDLVQETFIRAYRAFDRFELREYGAKPWLLRILHNVFYTAKGRQRRSPTLLDDVDFDHFADELNTLGEDPLTLAEMDWEQFDEELKTAVEGLQPEYRSVLLLWAIEGLSYRGIAEICDCPIGTVMSRLYRARQLVGRELGEYARERGIRTERFAE